MKRIKGQLSSLLEGLWIQSAKGAGALIQTRATALPKASRVVAIAPHPDDEVIGCGGTLLEHTRLKDRTCAVIITDGRDSRATGLSPKETAELRYQEALRAQEKLGLSTMTWLGHPERDWSMQTVAKQLEEVLKQELPEIVYAPSRIDGHPVHFQVAKALAMALSAQPVPRVRIYQAQILLTPVLVNRAFDISASWPRLLSAYEAYASQRDGTVRTQRLKRYEGGLYGAPYAEVFWEMSSARYCSLHITAPSSWPTEGYFGLRKGAFRDPLAFMVGLSKRRSLAKIV